MVKLWDLCFVKLILMVVLYQQKEERDHSKGDRKSDEYRENTDRHKRSQVSLSWMCCHEILWNRSFYKVPFFVLCIIFQCHERYCSLCIMCTKGFFYHLSHDCHIQCRYWLPRFKPRTAAFHQAIVLIYWVELIVSPWLYKIPCKCTKVYFGETGRCVDEQIKEHYRDIRLSWTQTSAVSEYANTTRHYLLWDKEKFIDQDPTGTRVELKRLFT